MPVQDTLIDQADKTARHAPCPVCRRPAGYPCHWTPGQPALTHSGRKALRLAELEAIEIAGTRG